MPRNEDDLIQTRVTLLYRLKDWRDQSSWQEFFDIYWKLIYGVARRAGLTETESQDVVQETLASVARHMPAFKYDPANGSFKTWLLNMTRWRIVDQVRKRSPAARTHPDSDETSQTETLEKIADPNSTDLNSVWDADWEKNLLVAAIARIKPKVDPQKFQMFDFCVNKEWPPEKVAQSFGVPVAQVYLAKHRITELLREEVRRLEKEVM